MGYYTQYSFTVLEGGEELIEKFREENENAKYAFDESGSTESECKWYDSQKELLEFSMKHPNALFLLEGNGEENGDQWKLYVQSGHFQVCKAEIVFEEFDKAKLLSDIRESKINTVLK